jgi:arylsulfatase A-like enzyme
MEMRGLTSWPVRLLAGYVIVGSLAVGSLGGALAEPAERNRPNIVLILADDLGYGDLGCYGQQQIQTPHLDRLAADGIRFTQCYAGSTVCAPSRCVLMTGLHTGHARVRGNALVPLEPDDVTVAEVLHEAGYRTGIIGKWGLGEPETTGLPTEQGFDTWFGYLNQTHAHNYYPEMLWRNTTRVELPENRNDRRGSYSADLFRDEAVRFLQAQGKEPFFLYLALTLPHTDNELARKTGNGMEIPSDAPYRDRSWPAPQKNHAAMITRLDADIGAVLNELDRLSLDRSTLVLFASDNGPLAEGGADPKFFQSSGGLRGHKRDLYEGGIRTPMIARWRGKIPAGQTSDLIWWFADLLPTLADLVGAPCPDGLDGISVAPILEGGPSEQTALAQPRHLYWEFHERGSKQAVRSGKWKGVRRWGEPLELFDLEEDRAETANVAHEHPEVVRELEKWLENARTESAHWRMTAAPGH